MTGQSAVAGAAGSADRLTVTECLQFACNFADSKHYFSVRHSVARLELSASASEVIRHAGAI